MDPQIIWAKPPDLHYRRSPWLPNNDLPLPPIIFSMAPPIAAIKASQSEALYLEIYSEMSHIRLRQQWANTPYFRPPLRPMTHYSETNTRKPVPVFLSLFKSKRAKKATYNAVYVLQVCHAIQYRFFWYRNLVRVIEHCSTPWRKPVVRVFWIVCHGSNVTSTSNP